MSSPEGRGEAEDEEEMERSHRGSGRRQLRPGVQNEELLLKAVKGLPQETLYVTRSQTPKTRSFSV